jgi:AraC family transcriptional regulator
MFRALNEEPRERSIQAVRTFAPREGSEIEFRSNLFNGKPASGSAIAAVANVRGGLPPRVVRRLLEHIDCNIDRNITVEDLAKIANLSASYFARAFKRSVGLTPHDYLIRRRVERTIELLSDTDMPLSEIALATGFADQSHFARRFRQHVGVTPRTYRWSIP